VFDILEQNDGWPTGANQPGDFEEQRPLRLVEETVVAAKADLLAHTREAERLTREARGHHVVRWQRLDIADVITLRLLEVGGVRLSGELVFLNGVDASAINGLKAEAETPNTCEQIYEGKGRNPTTIDHDMQPPGAERPSAPRY